MKDAKSFSETLYLLMEDFEYSENELDNDIKDFFKSKYSLKYVKEENKEFYILESNELTGNIKINITTILKKNDKHIFIVDSVKEF